MVSICDNFPVDRNIGPRACHPMSILKGLDPSSSLLIELYGNSADASCGFGLFVNKNSIILASSLAFCSLPLFHHLSGGAWTLQSYVDLHTNVVALANILKRI